MKMQDLKLAYCAVLAHMTSTAMALVIIGAEPQTTVLVAGGLGIIASEIAVRYFGRGGGGRGAASATA
ncbi:MAG: hypothetical protein ABIZ05_14965 [Pseudonocardiaceae bacterium]